MLLLICVYRWMRLRSVKPCCLEMTTLLALHTTLLLHFFVMLQTFIHAAFCEILLPYSDTRLLALLTTSLTTLLTTSLALYSLSIVLSSVKSCSLAISTYYFSWFTHYLAFCTRWRAFVNALLSTVQTFNYAAFCEILQPCNDTRITMTPAYTRCARERVKEYVPYLLRCFLYHLTTWPLQRPPHNYDPCLHQVRERKSERVQE